MPETLYRAALQRAGYEITAEPLEAQVRICFADYVDSGCIAIDEELDDIPTDSMARFLSRMHYPSTR